jgi:preprotein translocase subunit SecG
MTTFLIILHVLVCVVLILFVLLQPGARGGVGAAFGGAGGQTVFGGRGANTFLAKLTAAAAVIFMVTSISLSYFVSHTQSVMRKKADTSQTEGKKDDEKKAETPDQNAPEAAPGKPAPPEKPVGEPPPAP